MEFNVSNQDKYKVGVYCIKNKINNKIYIGSTGNSFYDRYHQHISDYKKGKHNGIILKRAFDKYNINNFEFFIICICNVSEIIEKEQYYINKGTDYNCSLVAGSLLGLKHNKNSKTRTIKGSKHHSSKHVYQFDLNGNLMQKFGSIIEALTSIGKTKNGSSHITQCCLGNFHSIFGYKWSFTEILIERLKKEPGKKKNTISIEKNGEIKLFNSQVETAEYFQKIGFTTKQSSISNAIRLNNKLHGYIINKIK